MLPLPPRSTLFPYTTLFRSGIGEDQRLHPRRMAAQQLEDDVATHRESAHDGLPHAEGVEHGHQVVGIPRQGVRSEEHTSELQSHSDLVCRLLLEKKNTKYNT